MYQEILRCANRGLSRLDFLSAISGEVMECCGCDAVEIRLNEGELHYCWEAQMRPRKATQFKLVEWAVDEDGMVIPAYRDETDLERLCAGVACEQYNESMPFFTTNGSFWIGDTWEPLAPPTRPEPFFGAENFCVGGHYRSLVLTRFLVGKKSIGLLLIRSESPHAISEKQVQVCEEIAQMLGLAVTNWLAQAALRERIKELTCLYGIALAAEQIESSEEQVLQNVVELIPAGWQFPENAAARIVLDNHPYITRNFRPSKYMLSADIVTNGERRGVVEIVYLEHRPELAAGIFLKEEIKLIGAVAREVALIIGRRESEQEQVKLQQQLVHADRLASIGQLAAGVAHEFNEPLGNILGFAQLTQKCPGLPDQAKQDIEKIITASLYAREVIKKLMVFARPMPVQKIPTDLNQLVDDGLYFLEARCEKRGIHIVRNLASDLPSISVDPAQIRQVLVNLVVNALHAMQTGGELTVSTRMGDSCLLLGVADTGTGIPKEILDKIFLPFYTTKDVDEGTGLGLAVVHGIVKSHGGSIATTSELGNGTQFEISLPRNGTDQTGEVTANDTCK